MYPTINPYGGLAEKKRIERISNFLVLGAIGCFVALVAGAATFQGSPIEDFLMVLFPVSAILWIVGCCYYAKSKGHSAAVGLIGMLSIVGLLVLLLISDKWKAALKLQEQFANMPPTNPFGGVSYPR